MLIQSNFRLEIDYKLNQMYSDKLKPIESILLVEQITDIDTLTLQQKIEELQAHPEIKYYDQILNFAKLQLIQRKQIEDFGMKLLNDEIQIPKLPQFPPIGLEKKHQESKQSIKVQPKSKTERKKQLSQILKTTATVEDFVIIGKPTIGNYRYTPQKPIQMKKSSTRHIKNPVQKKQSVPPKMLQKNLKNIEIPIIKPKKQEPKQQIPQKKKPQPEIKYIQNDVYDELKEIKEQKLVDLTIETEDKTSHQETILEEIETHQNQQQIIEQVIDSQKKDELQNSVAIDIVPQEQKRVQVEILKDIEQEKHSQQSIQQIQQNEKRLEEEKIEESFKIQKIIEEKKQQKMIQKIQPINPKNHQAQKPSPKKIQLVQSTKTSILFHPKKVYPNYHEMIPSFGKLFPHSKNLLADLRVIEQQLTAHLQKNITKNSMSDEYLKLRYNDLLFRVVSETEKAKKYSHLFDIDLSSFYERSSLMLNRIHKNHKLPSHHEALLYRVIRQKEDVYDIVNSTFHRTFNWFQVPHGMDTKVASWNLLWSWSKPIVEWEQVFYFQKVNHFIGNKEIARKDLLKKNIEKVKKLGKKAKALFDIIPETFLLPAENIAFVKKFRQYSLKSDQNYWILKPVGLSRGRGIELVSKIEDIVFSEPVIMQKYLPNPLLLDGFKFDMRIYVLVTEIKPLKAYIYKQGFARISTEKYSINEEQITNKFIHLTNFSVQKDNVENTFESFEKKVGGCKITLKMLRQKLSQFGIEWENIWSQIETIVIKSLVACMSQIEPNPNCFELFGYDIIIDEDMKCWLIEVNASPSLEKEFLIDEIIKQQLVDDIIQIVNPIPYDRQRLLEVISRRRKELEGLKSHINSHNNSIQQLDEDLAYILHERNIMPKNECENNFKAIIPSQKHDKIIKVIQQYKITQQ